MATQKRINDTDLWIITVLERVRFLRDVSLVGANRPILLTSFQGGHIRTIATVCLACAAGTASLSAQTPESKAPWTVTVKPSMNPLPVPFCAPVWLSITDAAGKFPRNPAGYRVSLAEFDMAVSAPNVVGVYGGPDFWSVCACLGAPAGTVATITATYPARALAENARVRGVAVKASATFATAKPKGNVNPPACQSAGARTIAQAGPPPVPLPPGGTPPIAKAPATPVVAPVAPPRTPSSPIAIAPAPTPVVAPVAPPRTPSSPIAIAPAPTPVAAPTGTPRAPSSPIPIGPAPSGAPAPPGSVGAPVPTGFRLLPSVPIIASLAWDTMPNALAYTLWRAAGGGSPSIQRVSASQSEAKSARDTIPDPRITYRYTLVVRYADGTSAESPVVEFTSPPLVNPSGFTAIHRGDGNVDFEWQPVAGAAQYRLDGSGIPNTGFYTTDTSARYPKIPRGASSWKLRAVYQGNYADDANPSTASAVVRFLPPHTVRWLSKANGPGSDAVAAAHYAAPCPYVSGDGKQRSDCPPDLMRELGRVPGALNLNNLPVFQAVYGNSSDLGFGRRTSCAQGLVPLPGLFTTICWASSHGAGPGEAGFADPAAITQAATQNNLTRTVTMIIKDATGMRFLVFGPPFGANYVEGSAPHSIGLDTEGQKFAPHTCLACHGGTYDPVANRVQGATLLPVEPGDLVFAGGPSGRAAQEESIRKINQFVLNSQPSAAVASYLQGLYGGKISQVGATAVTDYVPSGWSAQSGLYRSVVRPYCTTCHMAQPSYSFASWGNFQGYAALIRTAVCIMHSMPHAELQFKSFWMKDTGLLYLPGLLAASLGFDRC